MPGICPSGGTHDERRRGVKATHIFLSPFENVMWICHCGGYLFQTNNYSYLVHESTNN